MSIASDLHRQRARLFSNDSDGFEDLGGVGAVVPMAVALTKQSSSDGVNIDHSYVWAKK